MLRELFLSIAVLFVGLPALADDASDAADFARLGVHSLRPGVYRIRFWNAPQQQLMAPEWLTIDQDPQMPPLAFPDTPNNRSLMAQRGLNFPVVSEDRKASTHAPRARKVLRAIGDALAPPGGSVMPISPAPVYLQGAPAIQPVQAPAPMQVVTPDRPTHYFYDLGNGAIIGR